MATEKDPVTVGVTSLQRAMERSSLFHRFELLAVSLCYRCVTDGRPQFLRCLSLVVNFPSFTLVLTCTAWCQQLAQACLTPLYTGA